MPLSSMHEHCSSVSVQKSSVILRQRDSISCQQRCGPPVYVGGSLGSHTIDTQREIPATIASLFKRTRQPSWVEPRPEWHRTRWSREKGGKRRLDPERIACSTSSASAKAAPMNRPMCRRTSSSILPRLTRPTIDDEAASLGRPSDLTRRHLRSQLRSIRPVRPDAGVSLAVVLRCRMGFVTDTENALVALLLHWVSFLP